MEQHILLAVQGPLQLVNAISSLKWCFPNVDTRKVTLLLYDFLCPEDVELEVLDATLAIANIYSWRKICFISGSEMVGLSTTNIRKSIPLLKTKLDLPNCSTILFAQAEHGTGGPLLCHAYRDAETIAYGDGYGIWRSKKDLRFGLRYRLKHVIKSIRRGSFLSPPFRA